MKNKGESHERKNLPDWMQSSVGGHEKKVIYQYPLMTARQFFTLL